MPVDVRFFLLANIEHFTAQLQGGGLDERQEAATRMLLANARLRCGFLEIQAATNNARSPPNPLPPSRLHKRPSRRRSPHARNG